ncbi:hypothetical protein KAR91_80510 [Candidatus Pacearchaeota archaeon]|nr:hypothetical protein [Candidatus Pacearchaeota archaeon]
MIELDVISQPNLPLIEKTASNTFKKGTANLNKIGAKYLKGIIPVKSGNLSKSIHNNKEEIWTTAKHFKYVDEGTKPHIIEGLLRFVIHGAVIYARDVHHPGTKAQHLTDKTITHIEKNIPAIVKDIDRAIR